MNVHFIFIFFCGSGRLLREAAGMGWAGRSGGINFNYTCQCQGYRVANGWSDWFAVNREGGGGGWWRYPRRQAAGPSSLERQPALRQLSETFIWSGNYNTHIHTQTHTPLHNTHSQTIPQLVYYIWYTHTRTHWGCPRRQMLQQLLDVTPHE